MFVDTNCPGCQRKLRVAVEHAGRPARCPICNAIYTVPAAAVSVEPSDPTDKWRLKTPEGQEYGPVTREVLDDWVAQGRVSGDCQLLCETEGVWHGAEQVYAALRPAPVGVATTMWHNAPVQNNTASAAASLPVSGRGHVINSDRGGIVLALGILSWAVGCPIFGVMAWVMGNNDLREMRQGTMDMRGQGLTQAGLVIGMLHVLLAIAALFVGVFCLLVWGVFR